jgi:hypothetical protein
MTSTIKVNKIEKESGSTLTLGGPGTAITLACGATQTGFGRTGTVNWCTTAKTSPLTVASGNGYFINTSGGAVTVTLPASPSAGDIVAFKDYANTWDTNNVTVDRNSSKINGECHDATLLTESQSVTLIYVDGTKGWQDIHDSTSDITGAPNFVAASGGTVLTDGNFKTHVFTSSGTFQITAAGLPVGSTKVDYFVVAGGGGGGAVNYSGGGGAGGFRLSNCAGCLAAPTMSPLVNACGAITASVASFPITVGAGGSGSTGPGVASTKGADSVFSTITSAGGGRGFGDTVIPGSTDPDPLGPGGSGGGSNASASPAGSGIRQGCGNTPPVSPPQGNPGGTAAPGATYGSGGGGAGAAGTNGAPGAAGVGSFISDSFLGPTAPSYGTPGPASSVRYFAGGGGAGQNANYPYNGTQGAGGAGGGGAGGVPGFTGAPPNPAAPAGINGVAGTANTGGGGGGGGYGASPNNDSGAGGSGVVMIRYKFQ